MGKQQDRAATLKTLIDAHRVQRDALAAIMATVSVNTISAQNITDINAVGAAYDQMIRVANAAIYGGGD